jgi:nucleoside-diphosphate-sugar epimerase
MRVLLAGASGVLGRHLARELTAAGHLVIGLGRGAGAAPPGTEFVRADLMDRDGLLRAMDGIKVDAVIHAATGLHKTPMRHQGMATTNALRTEGMANLVEAARLAGARRLVSESMHLGYGYGDWGDTVITEAGTAFAPPGRGRWLERHLAGFRAKDQYTFGSEGIDGISLRFGALYGPGFGAGGTDTLVQLLRRRRLPVTPGRALMHWTYLPDAATAAVAALEHGRPGHAYNIVDDEPTTFADHIRLVAATFRTPAPPTVPLSLLHAVGPYAYAVMTTSMRVSNAKATSELPWAPSMPDCAAGLRAMAEGVRGAPHP